MLQLEQNMSLLLSNESLDSRELWPTPSLRRGHSYDIFGIVDYSYRSM